MRAVRAPGSALLVALLLLAGACSRGPEAIAYGRDACDYCRMVISDPRYGAELVTAKGKVHTFDSIECLASFYLQLTRRPESGTTAPSMWVSDYTRPGTLVPVDSARFARVAGPASPMGKGLTAFAVRADSATVRRLTNGAPLLRWDDVVALVEREGMPRGAATAAGVAPEGGDRADAR